MSVCGQVGTVSKARMKQIRSLYKSTAQKKEDKTELNMIESLILLKNLAEQTRMEKILDNNYDDALPKEESGYERNTQRQYDQVT